MTTVMLIVDAADGLPCPHAGLYVKRFDPDKHGGRGELVTTDAIEQALRFPSAVEALALWKQQSSVLPLRPDGEPNRPLTAFTVELVNLFDCHVPEELDDAGAEHE